MTTRESFGKWAWYGSALLLLCLIQLLVSDQIVLFGARPTLLPLCAATVAVWEEPSAGAGFGLAAGLLSVVAFPHISPLIVLFLYGIGLLSSLMGKYVLQNPFLCSFLCSWLSLFCIACFHVIPSALQGIPLQLLLSVALPELFYSMACFFPVYILFRRVHKTIQKRFPFY